MPPTEEARRKQLCDHLGREALAGAPRVLHTKFACPGSRPPSTPDLPFGTLWGLINHLKVLHQNVRLLGEAACQGPHGEPLFPTPEARRGLEWFDPSPLQPDAEAEVHAWCSAHRDAPEEAAFHMHQAGEDMGLARFLVRRLLPSPSEFEAEIASNILRARPASYADFRDQLVNWRQRALYHLLCLAARSMPMASDWVPRALLHEADDWQDLLTEFNQKSFCSSHRLEAILERLEDRSAMLSNRICSLLDRVAILARVDSTRPGRPLDESLRRLIFLQSHPDPYDTCREVWGRLKRTLEEHTPPSLLCPTLYPPNRATWGFKHLKLRMGESPFIYAGPLAWIDKEHLDQCREHSSGLPDRLHDILLRIGEAATAPEVAHLMLDPRSLTDALAGLRTPLPDLSNRQFVLNRMNDVHVDNEDFTRCIERALSLVPPITHQPLFAPQQFLAWRVDCPPRAILYRGHSTEVNLAARAPHALSTTIHPDRVPSRTVSGVSVLAAPTRDPAQVHDAIRACIAEEVVAPHPNFSEHPHHQVPIRVAKDRGPVPHTTTTLAEAVALFTGPPPGILSEVPLHASVPWDEGHIDTQYAERQVGSNGSRYRHWLTVFHDVDELQRCRLASHTVLADQLYHTHYPLVGLDGQGWVRVTSTAPPPHTPVLIRHQPARTPAEALKRSVEMRFMNDPKLLPVRSPDHVVERDSMEIYSDPSGQTLIAYAPKGALGLEFVSFAYAMAD